MKKNTNKKIAFVGSNPFSTIRFRGTIISKLIEFGYEVFVFTFTMSENEKKMSSEESKFDAELSARWKKFLPKIKILIFF